MKIIELGTNRPITYLPAVFGSVEPLALAPEQPELATYTRIEVSPDSSLMQAVQECKTIWVIHTHEAVPLWIAHNPEALTLATALNEELGGNIELRATA